MIAPGVRRFLEEFGLLAAALLLSARAWIVTDDPAEPCCALGLAPAGDMPVDPDQLWFCTPCALAIVEVHAIYHHGGSSA